jgi:hypothetical protein
MKYYIYIVAACALITIGAGTASASGPSVNISVPSSFAISEFGKAIDSVSDELAPGPGPVTFARGDNSLYVTVPAPARNGTRLVSLEDRESGIVFRNNTLTLPVYAAGEKAGSLVAATDNLTADRDGFSGQVTGLELRLAGIASTRNGTNFTAGAVILMRDLPAGAEYSISFTDNDPARKAISEDLEARGQAVAGMSPLLDLGGVNQAGKDAIGYVIVTVQADVDWPVPYGADNITFYRYSDGQLSRLQSRLMKTENGIVYQAVVPGTGQFALVAAGPLDRLVTDASAMDAGALAVLSGILAVLLIALVAMVRRVTKR